MPDPLSSPGRPAVQATSPVVRPAWVEIDRSRLHRNLELIRANCPAGVQFLSVVKDNAYGHGAVEVAKAAMRHGAAALGVYTVEEALELRRAGLRDTVLLFGERESAEAPICVNEKIRCVVTDAAMARELAAAARAQGGMARVHVKVNTGMNRFGADWQQAVELVSDIAGLPGLRVEGVMSHFAMSDELDKSFAQEQFTRFQHVLEAIAARGIRIPLRHICNSGGFLDLPQAHLDMVRVGILQHGIHPSQVCRRIPGLEPTMTVKARVSAERSLRPGDHVGYGMRWTASRNTVIAVLQIGYGDGYPRLRNMGHVLIRGARAPIVGGVTMDALMVDVTDVPGAARGDEAVLMGRQGTEEITAHDLARWKGSVSYDIVCGWRSRLPRIYIG